MIITEKSVCICQNCDMMGFNTECASCGAGCIEDGRKAFIIELEPGQKFSHFIKEEVLSSSQVIIHDGSMTEQQAIALISGEIVDE